ncbi:hypothetical protein [Martelella limonii]|uniref:hypothetical protein n=1 Tax=Martelella limonii TaxID=1647649 RepID=UPI0015806F98|nr:hypothetical protein [Martelella limonii]
MRAEERAADGSGRPALSGRIQIVACKPRRPFRFVTVHPLRRLVLSAFEGRSSTPFSLVRNLLRPEASFLRVFRGRFSKQDLALRGQGRMRAGRLTRWQASSIAERARETQSLIKRPVASLKVLNFNDFCGPDIR